MSGERTFIKEICFDIGMRLGELQVFSNQPFMNRVNGAVFEWADDVAEEFHEWWNALDEDKDSDKLCEYTECLGRFLTEKLEQAGFVSTPADPDLTLGELRTAYASAGTEAWDVWPDFDEEGDTGLYCIGSRECASLVTCGEGTEQDAKRVAMAHNAMPKLLEVARWADATREWAQTCFPEYANVEVVNELQAALQSLDKAAPGKKPTFGA